MITRSQNKSRKPINSQTNHQISTLKNCRVVVKKLDTEKLKISKTKENNQKIQCKVVLKDVLKHPTTIPYVSKSNDASQKIFSKCDSPRCQLKQHFSLVNEFNPMLLRGGV